MNVECYILNAGTPIQNSKFTIQNNQLKSFFYGNRFSIRIQLYYFVPHFLQARQYFFFIAHQQYINLFRPDPFFSQCIYFWFGNVGQYFVLPVYIISRQVVFQDPRNKAGFLQTRFVTQGIALPIALFVNDNSSSVIPPVS